MLIFKKHIFLKYSVLFFISIFYLPLLFADNDAAKTEQQMDKSGSGFIFYGNWCGPNHPPDMTKAAEPIDLLDAQCKTHDLCYFDKGDFDCGCDRAMVKEIDQNQKMKRFTREQYLLAQNIKLHFALSPCNGQVDGNKALPTRILTRVYNGTKNRVLNTYDRFIGNRFPGMKRTEDAPKASNKNTTAEDAVETESPEQKK